LTFEVPGVDSLLLARWFLGSAATELAEFPPEFVAELRPDLAKIGPLGLLAHCLPCWRVLGASVPLDSLHYWSSCAPSQLRRPSFPARLVHVNGGLS